MNDYEAAISAVPEVRRCSVHSFGDYSGIFIAKIRLKGSKEPVYALDYFGSCSLCDAFQAEFGILDDTDTPQYRDRLISFGRDYIEKSVPFDTIFQEYFKKTIESNYDDSDDALIFKYLKNDNPERAKELMNQAMIQAQNAKEAQTVPEHCKPFILGAMCDVLSGGSSMNDLGYVIYSGLEVDTLPSPEAIMDYLTAEDTQYWEVDDGSGCDVSDRHIAPSRFLAVQYTLSDILSRGDLTQAQKEAANEDPSILGDSGFEIEIADSGVTYTVTPRDFDWILVDESDILISLTNAYNRTIKLTTGS